MTHGEAFFYAGAPCQKLASAPPINAVTKPQSKQDYGHEALRRSRAPGRICPALTMPQASGPTVERADEEGVQGMKVTGPAGPSGASGARPAPAQSAAPGFQPITTPAAQGAAGVTSAGAVSHISSLQALIALQDVDGPTERRRRAVGRAGKLLDALDGLKLDLLEGALSPGSMEALTRAVREQRSLTDDPKLEGLLDEIETRASVELAKLEGARVAT
jgi:hypothetical protein